MHRVDRFDRKRYEWADRRNRWANFDPTRDWFGADGSRMTERMWRDNDQEGAVTRSLRCYSPADLRPVTEGTGLVLRGVDAYADEGYGATAPLLEAMLYPATLVPG